MSPGEISSAHGISIVYSCFMNCTVHPCLLQAVYNWKQRRQTRGNGEKREGALLGSGFLSSGPTLVFSSEKIMKAICPH